MPDNQELNNLLRDMRCDVIWTDKATMPIPLYERMKEVIKRLATQELTSKELDAFAEAKKQAGITLWAERCHYKAECENLQEQLTTTQQALDEAIEVTKISREQLNVAIIGFEAIKNELVKGVISWPSIKTMIKATLNVINRKENSGAPIALLENQVISLQQALDSSCQTNQILVKRLMIAAEALKFYASVPSKRDNCYSCKMPLVMMEASTRGSIWNDLGTRAKAALASIKE